MNMYSSSATGNEQKEGKIARTIEHQTAKIPSDVFLWVAGAAIVGSASLQLISPKRMGLFGIPSRHGQLSLFVGQWVPTLLLLGVYNKIVKVLGSDGRNT
ncbi:hypothetical protein [Pendulispora albinea]|uniref:Uncharacterized protein n=1 Tax=Pendulispora albinea TaxID=2741071 RepID=A0ABZ2LVF6_9BACT